MPDEKKKPEVSTRYLDYVRREIELVAARLPDRRRVNQVHWGGGTPTYHRPEEMETQVTKLIEESVNTISGLEELRSAMEYLSSGRHFGKIGIKH